SARSTGTNTERSAMRTFPDVDSVPLANNVPDPRTAAASALVSTGQVLMTLDRSDCHPATTTESHAHPNATAVLMGRLRSIAPCRVLYLACVGYCRSCVPGGNRSAVDRLDRGLWKPVTPPSTPHRERCHRDDHGAECERQCVATTPRLPAAWRRWRERQRAIGPVVDRIGEFLIPITNQNRIGSRRSTKVHDSCRTHPSCCMSGGDRAPRASTAQFDAAGNQLNTPVGSADDHAHAESDADRGSSCVLIMT